MIMMDACHSTFIQTHRMYTATSEPRCKLRTKCQCSSSAATKRAHLVADAEEAGKATHARRQGEHGKLPYLLNIAVNVKLL